MLKPDVWQELEAHGVTTEHMAMLLQALRVRKNGSVSWHFASGTLTTCDLRLTFASRPYEVQRISDTVLGDNSLLR